MILLRFLLPDLAGVTRRSRHEVAAAAGLMFGLLAVNVAHTQFGLGGEAMDEPLNAWGQNVVLACACVVVAVRVRSGGAPGSKLLLAGRPALGLELAVETGLAEQFLPELPALKLEQDPVHRHKDVLRHTLAVVERCEPDLKLRLAALLHDIGKPATRTFTEEGVQFHHHEVVGARMAEERLRALRYPNDVVSDVVKLIEMHLRFHTFRMGWSDSALRRYVRDAGPLLDPLNQLVRADCTTRDRQKAKALAALQDELEVRIARLAEQENLERLRPPLDGHEVMARLGVPPGPVVGQALDYLMEQRLDRGPIEKEEAYRLLDEWAARHAAEAGEPPA